MVTTPLQEKSNTGLERHVLQRSAHTLFAFAETLEGHVQTRKMPQSVGPIVLPGNRGNK